MSTTPTTDGPDELDRLYAYAAWMIGDREAALGALRTALASGARGDLRAGLAAMRTAVLAQAAMRRQTPARRREELDTVLRTGTSVSLKMGNSTVHRGVRRLPVLLTGFMQSCLIAAVGALPPALRELFVLQVVLGMPDEEVLTLIRPPKHGLSGSRSRMLGALDGYLGPRCGHLHPANPCKCPNRLQIALERGFVQLPEHELASEDYPVGVFGDLREMFAALPPLRLAPRQRAALGA